MKSPFSYFIISVFGSLLLLFLIPHAYAGYYNVEYATNQNVHCSGYVAGTTTSCTTPNNITGYIDVVFNNYYTANAFTIYKNSVQIGGTYTSWFNSNHSVNYASDVYSINCPACSYVWVSLSYHIVSNATGPNRIIFSNTTNYNNSITAHPLNETFYVNTWIEDNPICTLLSWIAVGISIVAVIFVIKLAGFARRRITIRDLRRRKALKEDIF